MISVWKKIKITHIIDVSCVTVVLNWKWLMQEQVDNLIALHCVLQRDYRVKDYSVEVQGGLLTSVTKS